ncbi:MAG: paraquat-inducible protein A [Pseudomonadota bacterium]
MEIAGSNAPVLTARAAGLVGCHRCTRVWPQGTPRCARCGTVLHRRKRHSLQRVWAWWLAGVLCYIPANIYPMLSTRTLFTQQEDTIIGGAIQLIHQGSYGVALIILVASVVIPLGKFLAIAFLAFTIARGTRTPARLRHGLHKVVEYIGRWSMIDVFVVAILSSLVQLNVVAAITPGPASLTFALSVIFTMLSAQAFDGRMIWDRTAAAAEET